MKTISKVLADFINDYALVEENDSICFDAIIYFTTARSSIHLPSEVHISLVGKKNMDRLYLLDPAITKHEIPEKYQEGSQEFSYFPNRALVIQGESPVNGKFILSIHPGDKECDEKTLAELHGKMYN